MPLQVAMSSAAVMSLGTGRQLSFASGPTHSTAVTSPEANKGFSNSGRNACPLRALPGGFQGGLMHLLDDAKKRLNVTRSPTHTTVRPSL
jgi:hypothetical protein